MAKTDLKDLMKTVEDVRREISPDLDPQFLKSVIRIEEENPEDDESALEALQDELKKTLSKKGGR